MTPRRHPGPTAGHLAHHVLDLLASERRALHVTEIATRLELRDRAALRDALDELLGEGLVLLRPGQRYRVAAEARIEQAAPLDGVIVINPRGFGFVRVSGAFDDVHVPADAIGAAMHGDRVRVRVVAHTRRGRQGEVVEVLSRGLERVVGVLRGRVGHRFLVPDDGRVRGPIEVEHAEQGEPPGSKAGIAAVVELTRFPESQQENPRGRLLAVLGEPGDPDVEVAKILLVHGVDEEHDPEALAQAKAYGDAPDPSELERREDLRDVPLITIDPHDARDHDDAVWVERDEQGRYEAWIAIADVSHYVTEGSALDVAARKRGFSVYLPDRAVPMLPSELSAVLCSLLPEVERLCLCVHVHLSATGEVRRARIVEGRMRARAFLSYDAVARALDFSTEPQRDPAAEERRDALAVLWDLASLLRKRRMSRGALDLDIPEARVEIDDATRAPIAVRQRSTDPGVAKAYRLVEEMMLLANEVVAKHVLSKEIPAIFRIHGPPDPDKLMSFAALASALGVEFDPEEAADPKKLSKFLRKVTAHPKKAVLHGGLLRAMQQATYDAVNVGHFGLASSAYLHFTSPIRRYPDLIVHRLIRAALRQRPPRADVDAELREMAAEASRRERNAMEAEREVADLYRALYMRAHVGDSFDGTVTGITPGCVYLRLDDPFVDVQVPLDALGLDGYDVDESGLRAVGARSGDTITLGDSMRVLIEDVAIMRRSVLGRRVLEPGKQRADKKARKADRRAGATKAKGGRRKAGRRGRR